MHASWYSRNLAIASRARNWVTASIWLGRNWMQRFIVLLRDVERRVQVVEPARQHRLDVLGAGAGWRAAPAPDRARAGRRRSATASRAARCRRSSRHDITTTIEGTESAIPRSTSIDCCSRVTVLPSGTVSSIWSNQQHERGRAGARSDRAQLPESSASDPRAESRGARPPSSRVLVGAEPLAAQEPDHAALEAAAVAALEQQQRMDEVGLEVAQALGAQDAVDHLADQRVELLVAEHRGCAAARCRRAGCCRGPRRARPTGTAGRTQRTRVRRTAARANRIRLRST